MDKQIREIQTQILAGKNITLVFPPLYKKQEVVSKVLEKNQKKIITLDCRLLADLSIESFLKSWLFLITGKDNPIVTNQQHLIVNINKVLNYQKEPIILVINNMQYILPIIEQIILSLDAINESLVLPLQFIFTTTSNLNSERIYERVKAFPFILDNLYYFSLNKNDLSTRETEIVWNSLFEIQRRLIRLIAFGEKEFEKQFYPDLEYLLKTGLITQKKDFYINNLNRLNEVLQSDSHQILNLKKDHIFYGEELIHHKFTAKQVRVLKLLIQNKNKIIDRDKIAGVLWKEKTEELYSDWAIDKFIQRLRKKLEQNMINANLIKTLKTKGFIFEPQKTPITINEKIVKNELIFEKIRLNKEVVNFHVKSFQSQRLRKILYTTTPKTKKEIIDWIKEVVNEKEFAYFLVRKNSHILGHIGLDRIDNQTRSARVGFFMLNPNLWSKYGEIIFKFIIDPAKERNLHYLYVDVAASEKRQIEALYKAGFKKSLSKENILFLKI